MYSLGELGSLIRRNSAEFEKKSVKIFGDRTCAIGQIIISSIALKLEITVLFGISRGVTRILWVYQSLLRASLQKKGLFFRAVNFKASYSDFLYNLSTWSLSLLNFLKRWFLRFNFSITLPSKLFLSISFQSLAFIGNSFVNNCH